MTMAMAAAVVVALLVAPRLGLAEERPTVAHPHGLPFESPLALSPAAYEFFHPSERAARRGDVAVSPALSPRGQGRMRESAVQGASAASVARADQEEGGVAPVKRVRRGGGAQAGVLAGVFVGAAAVVVLAALGVAYAVARRRVAHGGDAVLGAPAKSNA